MNKLLIYPYILFLIIFNNFPLLSLEFSQNKTVNEISVEYLDQLPTKDYIIGPGDTLEVLISRDVGSPNIVTVDGENKDTAFVQGDKEPLLNGQKVIIIYGDTVIIMPYYG